MKGRGWKLDSMKFSAWVGRIHINFKEGEVPTLQNEWGQCSYLLCHCNMHAMPGAVVIHKIVVYESSSIFRKPNRPWNMFCLCPAATRSSARNHAWQPTGYPCIFCYHIAILVLGKSRSSKVKLRLQKLQGVPNKRLPDRSQRRWEYKVYNLDSTDNSILNSAL